MADQVNHPAPRIASNEGVMAALVAALGASVLDAREEYGEITLTVSRDEVEDALRILRDAHDYQQLMEIAGVDYPQRAERFEVVYHLLSLTKNHRIRVKCMTDEAHPVPTVTTLWPVAGWLEREVFDMYGVLFAGNTDLRRILTDYGFQGHPFRKDFPLTGYVELRYSEEDKRVVYEPVELAQDLRTFDFMSPWEGADYVLPGDEKAVPAPAPAPAPAASAPAASAPAPVATEPRSRGAPKVDKPKTTDKPADTGAGAKANAEAAKKTSATVTKASPNDARAASNARKSQPNVPKRTKIDETAPEPTEKRPARKPRASKTHDTAPATKPRARRTKPDGGAA
ncbi:NADH-quinone oxidoreductase subunit C [Novosphingobium tardum]|uniref:NADH-quinone oxidoreductase subunit C n=1 Tax=Novosphingobium tardum TaxID=1538021 RepID=A0ABV8RQ55_9SPHN